MNTGTLFPTLISATLFLFPLTVVQAESAPPADDSASPASSHARLDQIVQRFDRNGDGKLDETEKAAAKAAMGGEDKSAGGLRDRMIEHFDKNGDGQLDDAEKQEARAAREKRQAGGGPTNTPAAAPAGPAGPGGRAGEAMKRFDKNGDGKLDETERAEADQAARTRLEQTPRALERFDTDKDGKLNDAEWATAREGMRKRFSDGAGAP